MKFLKNLISVLWACKALRLYSGMILWLGGLNGLSQSLQTEAESHAIWNEATMTRSWVENLYPNTEIEPPVNASERETLQSLIPVVRQNPRAALNQIRQSIRSDSSAALHFMQGSIHYELEEFSAAASAYMKAIEKFPKFQRAYQYLGMTLLRQNRHQEAIPNLTQALELGGADGALWGALGYAYLLGEDWTAGRAAYQRAVSLNPDSFEWRLGLAQCDLGSSNFGSAIAALETLSDKHPEKARVWLYLANAYLGSDRPVQAAMALEAAEKLGRKDVSTSLTLGDIYTNLEMIRPAQKKYLSALELNPSIALQSLPRAVDSWIRLEAWEEAENLIANARATSEWTSLSASDRSSWNRLEAMVAIHQGKDESAEKVLLQALELDPMDGRIALELARFYTRQEKWIVAADYFSRARKTADVEFQALTEEARMWTLADDWEKGVERYRAAYRKFPESNLQKTISQLEQSIEARKGR